MPKDEVAAEFLACGQRLLEVDFHARAQFRKGSFAKSFPGEIGGEPIVFDCGDRQAAAAHGDAVGDAEMLLQRWRLNGDAPSRSVGLQRVDDPGVFDNAGEHGPSFLNVAKNQDSANLVEMVGYGFC